MIDPSTETRIVETVLEHYPQAQAIYMFGSYGTGTERPESDVDVAVLLPHDQARRLGNLVPSACHIALETLLSRPVDLLNARALSTVFQKELLRAGRLLFSSGAADRAEFEMLTLSLYQKLNDERAAILKAFDETGEAYHR